MTENPTKAADDSSVAKTHQAIGAFICAFSALDHELGEAIKVVLSIENHPAADAIVAIVSDFARKARLVQEAAKGVSNKDGTQTSPEWKKDADETMRRILGCNSPDRVDLVHGYLQPLSNGSVSVQKLGEKPKVWAHEQLESKIKDHKNLTVALRKIRADLCRFRLPRPDPAWMTTPLGSPTVLLNS
jgi:hypothetical protein